MAFPVYIMERDKDQTMEEMGGEREDLERALKNVEAFSERFRW
jgi:hypothetical protein